MYFKLKIYTPYTIITPVPSRKNALEFTIYKIYTFGITGFLEMLNLC